MEWRKKDENSNNGMGQQSDFTVAMFTRRITRIIPIISSLVITAITFILYECPLVNNKK